MYDRIPILLSLIICCAGCAVHEEPFERHGNNDDGAESADVAEHDRGIWDAGRAEEIGPDARTSSRDAGTMARRDAGRDTGLAEPDAGEEPFVDSDPDVFYVSPSGDDARDGLTSERAWKTLSHALAQLHPGQTLRVHGGQYDEIVNPTLRLASAAAPITVENVAGERPVVRGRVKLNRPTWWTWQGVNVTRHPTMRAADGSEFTDIFHVRDGRHWTVREVEVWGSHGYANLSVGGTTQYPGEPGAFVIEESCIHDIATTHTPGYQDHNIYVNFPTAGSDSGGEIRRNILYNAPNGSHVKVGAGQGAKSDPVNVTVHRNTMYGGARAMVLAHEVENTFIYNNLMVRATGRSSNEDATSPLIYAYHIDGPGNRFRSNYGHDAGYFLFEAPPFTHRVVAESGNAFNEGDPDFDSLSCSGFRPADSKAQRYGRYSP